MDSQLNLVNEQWEGWGTDSAESVERLVKALTAQEGVTDYSTLTGGGALMPQSLESTLAMLTFSDQHIKFWKQIGVQKAFSTLEEYTRQTGYGTEQATGGFVQQLENPEDSDPDLSRGIVKIKFNRAIWKVGDVMGHVQTITDAEVLAVQAAMMRILRATEENLFFSNSTMIPDAYDGLLATIEANAPANVIDLRGAALSDAVLKQGAEIIFVNYGTPTRMYVSPAVQTSIDALLTGANYQRVIQNQITPTGDITYGYHVTGMNTSFGQFKFEPDIFLSKESQPVTKIRSSGVITEGATSLKAPATPTLAGSPTGAPAVGSLWAGSGVRTAGKYLYRVVAINRFGKSRASNVVSLTSVAGQAISLTITEGGGTFPATAYEIYSTLASTTDATLLRYMRTVASSGATTTWQDLNLYIPGTGIAFLVDDTSTGAMRTMAFKQLAPIHRIEYARIAPYRWGVVQLYGAPVFYAPQRLVCFRNIGVGTPARNENLDL